MLKTNVHIIIGNYTMDFIHSCEIISSFKNFTDTAKIILPVNIKTKNNQLKELLKTGDKVQIQAGYNGSFYSLFKGYITGISPKIPTEIICEDEMWQLKQKTISFSIKDASLKFLLQQYYSEYTHKITDFKIGNYVVQNLNKARVLEDIKDKYGFPSFFRNGELYVGLIYDPNYAKTYKISFKKNIIEHDLIYRRKEDIKIKVTAISYQKDGKKIKISIGDKDGDERTLSYYNLSEQELKIFAEKDLEKFKYDGYQGSFTTFLEPFMRHGDIIEIIDDDGDKGGKFWVDEAVYEIGINGFRQKIKLGPKSE